MQACKIWKTFLVPLASALALMSAGTAFGHDVPKPGVKVIKTVPVSAAAGSLMSIHWRNRHQLQSVVLYGKLVCH